MKTVVRVVSAVLSVFVLFSSIAFSSIIFVAGSSVIRVPQDYATIHEAVDAANAGDRILVSNGTYEDWANITKSLTIVGEGANITKIVGGFEIHANNVMISGFSINGRTVVGLYNSVGCNISNNVLTGGWETVLLQYSNRNIIDHNHVYTWANEGAITLFFSDSNTVRENYVIADSDSLCIDLLMSKNNIVELNELTCGFAGLHAIEARNNTIRGNTMEKNWYGLFMDYGRNNNIYHNNIINNTHQVYVYGGGGRWDNGFQGNYWSDYNGSDLNGDGIGDTNLPWQEVDYYPLMKPWKPVLGDLNDDGIVNVLDVVVIASSYGAKPNDSSWNLLADLAQPWGVIDILDLVTLTSHYGSAWWRNT